MYATVDEIVTRCELLAEQFPDVVTVETLPEQTREGRPMHLVRVAVGPKAPRHALYIQANIHGNEWGTADIALHFLEQLVLTFEAGANLVFGDKVFGRDDIATALSRVELFIVPCVNPDGRAFSMTPGDDPGEFPNNLWRKNRRDNGTTCRGVDLNRNCDWLWDFAVKTHHDAQEDSQGSNACKGIIRASTSTCSFTYHGDKPFSEPESRNVKSVLDAHEHIRVFVDLHGCLGKIMTAWADDELQSHDPDMNFTNPGFDGLRGLRDTQSTDPGCESTPPHPDGAAYREYMHSVDQLRYRSVGVMQQQAVQEVRGTRYRIGTSFLEMYGMAGSMNDYAYSRHLADPSLPKIDGHIYEYENVDDLGFQPPFEDSPGPTDFIHVIRDLAAGLAQLLLTVDRIPIVSHAPVALDFGRVRVGTTRQLSVTLTNKGIRGFDVGTVQMLGNAGPISVGSASQTHLAPGESATIPVHAAPTDTQRSRSRVAIEFGYANDVIRDVRIVPCTVRGCSAPDDACLAPVFQPQPNSLFCAFRAIGLGLLIAALILFAWIPAVWCTIKQLRFKIRHCRAGNDDGCREL